MEQVSSFSREVSIITPFCSVVPSSSLDTSALVAASPLQPLPLLAFAFAINSRIESIGGEVACRFSVAGDPLVPVAGGATSVVATPAAIGEVGVGASAPEGGKEEEEEEEEGVIPSIGVSEADIIGSKCSSSSL